jgi:uncharacterized protein YbcC (UPF0753/DUF2309 family)
MTRAYSETQRMALRSQVRLASEIVAPYWPMRTFVHHNPLHELESRPFQEAVQRGLQLRGGRGYLSNALYRRYYRDGRIRRQHLEGALTSVVRADSVTIGDREVSHKEVLGVHVLYGLTAPADETMDALCERDADRDLVTQLMAHLSGTLKVPSPAERVQKEAREDAAALGQTLTVSGWCDQVLGTRLVSWINEELMRWCAAFLDEGHATWMMPSRDHGLFGAWKTLGQRDFNAPLCGIRGWRGMLAALPERSEDVILSALETLEVPESMWIDYLALHVAALPGWAAFLKWRAEQQGYAWQETYPATLVKYLAIRLFYEQQWTAEVCRRELGIAGSLQAVRGYLEAHPGAYHLRRARATGRLSADWGRRVDRLQYRWRPPGVDAWDAVASDYLTDAAERHPRAALQSASWRLLALAKALGIAPTALFATPPARLITVLNWLEEFPESEHGPRWLEALEAGYQESLLTEIVRARDTRSLPQHATTPAVRPQAQAVFCIDVRSEPVRRHLEAVGDYETFGFAGFFICFIRYRALGTHHDTDQFPVIMKARNLVREIPRSYHGDMLARHQTGAQLVRAGHTLVHDLKEHVITPYVMVETLGWFYGLPFFGKTILPLWYQRVSSWLRKRIAPPVSTSLTVDKLSVNEAEEMVASEQRAAIRRALRERLGLHGSHTPTELVEVLRLQALNGEVPQQPLTERAARLGRVSAETVQAFVADLRRQFRIDQRWASAQKERITRTGLTLEEQILTVETALRMMGLTRNFARLILLCAHGSTSDNNPFEAALDCGACGGNEGKPNARLFAAMANKPQVRERLAKKGIEIPPDTHFLAGQIDTTTDEVQLFDLEDVPTTHRKDLVRLLEDLKAAGQLTSQERVGRFPEFPGGQPPRQTPAHVRRRSADWSQVRPEWGLSGNTAFIIARRELTKALNLDGRTFLHSYDYRQDSDGRLLEIIMTAPQVVTQWINMEHYFSTVDNEAYGSGSKIYHNVVGRFGVMSGTVSDLRTGLAWQTVMNGELPYHEPMRLLTIIEAPRSRIEKVIQRHELLQRFYANQWVNMVVLDPDDGVLYRYLATGGWSPAPLTSAPQGGSDQ